MWTTKANLRHLLFQPKVIGFTKLLKVGQKASSGVIPMLLTVDSLLLLE